VLVIISDIHLSDESTSWNVDPDAFDLLRRDVQEEMEGREIRELQIVLLGDIVDLVRTHYWIHAGIPANERPWGQPLDLAHWQEGGMKAAGGRPGLFAEKQFNEVLDQILETESSSRFFGSINALAIEGRRSKPGYETRVIYVYGNHDRALVNYSSLREKIASRLSGVTENGLNGDRVRFLPEFHSEDYGVLARHGHQWDDSCHAWRVIESKGKPAQGVDRFDPDVSNVLTIGEVISAELMGGFIARVRQASRENPASKEIMGILSGLDNVRPMEDAVAWILWIARRSFAQSNEVRELLLDALMQSLDCLLSSPVSQQWRFSGSIRDNLRRILWALKWIGRAEPLLKVFHADRLQCLNRAISFIRWISAVRNAILHLLGTFRIIRPRIDNDVNGALTEFRPSPSSEWLQFVVYGHTHEPRHDCFSATIDGRVHLYVNTGTFLPLVSRIPASGEFSTDHQLNMVYFFRSEENTGGESGGGPTMVLWNGIKHQRYVRPARELAR